MKFAVLVACAGQVVRQAANAGTATTEVSRYWRDLPRYFLSVLLVVWSHYTGALHGKQTIRLLVVSIVAEL